MEEFRKKYYRLKFLMMELVSKIDKLIDEHDFFDRLGNIRSEISEIMSLKSELINSSNAEDYKKIESELSSYAKQIREKFDYIIEEKRRALNEVSIHIRNLQNSRKLVNYNR